MAEFTKISRRQMQMQESQNSYNVTDDINRSDIVSFGDDLFFDRTMFEFNNNRFVNAIFINELNDRENSDFSISSNIIYNKNESLIEVSDNTQNGIYYSSFIATTDNEVALLNDFFVVVDEVLPPGTDISYFLITNHNETYPIRPNNTMPLKFFNEDKIPTSFKIKIVLRPNGGSTPKLKGFAVLYHDQLVDYQLGLVNPDLVMPKDPPKMDDELILVREPMQGDKLTNVHSLLESINLEYSAISDELIYINVIDNVTGELKEKTELIYGDYINSNGETERVLQKVKTKNDFSDVYN